MPGGLGPCLEKSLLSQEEKDYLHSQSALHKRNGLTTADADRKAVMDFQHNTQSSLADIYNQVGIEGYEPNKVEKPIESAQMPVVKKEKKLSETRQKAVDIEDLTDPRSVALQHFAAGNKIHPSSVKDLFGSTGESKSRIGIIKNDAPTIDKMAHDMWESGQDSEGNNNYDTQDYKNAIEDVLKDHVSHESAAKELIATYAKNNIRADMTEEEGKLYNDRMISHVHEHLKGIDEDSKVDLTKILTKYQDQHGMIAWDKLKEDSQGFDPDILNLSEKTQKDLYAVIDKGRAEATKGHDQPDNASVKDSGGEKIKEEDRAGPDHNSENGSLPKIGNKLEGKPRTTPKQYSDPQKALEAVKEEHPDDKLLNTAADFLKPVIEGNKKIHIEDANLGGRYLGLSHPDGRIEVDFSAHPDMDAAHRTVVHELVHAATREEIFKNTALREELEGKLEEIRDALKLPKGTVGDVLIPALVDKGVIKPEHYGASNAHELLAEVFSNQKFYDLLKGIKVKGETMLKRVYDMIVGFFDKKYGALAKIKGSISADNMADYLMDLTQQHFKDVKASFSDEGGKLALARQQDIDSGIKDWIKKASDVMTDDELRESLLKHTPYSEAQIDNFILNDRNLTPEAKLSQKIADVTKNKKTLNEKIDAANKLTDQEIADIKASKKARNIATPIQNAVLKLKGISHAIIDAFENKPTFSNMDKAIGEWGHAKEKNDKQVMDMVHDLVKLVPDKYRREAMSNWIEAGGDVDVLKQRAEDSELKHKAGYILASHLTPHEIELAKSVGDFFDNAFKLGLKNGILKSQIQDYISHLGVKKDNLIANDLMTAIDGGKLNTSFKYAKMRTFQTFFDLENAGYTARTKDVANIIGVYSQTFNKALYSRAFIKNASFGKASDGRPLLGQAGMGRMVPNNDYPLVGTPSEAAMINPFSAPEQFSDYKSVDHFALRDWYWATKDDAGNPIFAKGNLVVHPDEYKRLKNILGKSALRDYALGRLALGGSNIVKQTIFSISPFFHYVQEGTHAIGHRINPVTGLKEVNFNDPIQEKLSKHGLRLYDFNAQSAFQEGLSANGLLKNVPIFNKTILPMQEHLFNSYIPRLKMTTAIHALERNLERNAGKLSEDAIYKQTAEQMNAAYGHLNYDMIGRNKTAQDVFRMLAIAPDFLEARARFVGQAVTKFGKEQRLAIMLLGASMYVTARALNKMIDDDYHWDEPFAVVHNGKKYRLRSVPEDIFEMFHDTGRFMYNRISPLSQALFETATKYDPVRGRQIDYSDVVKDILTSPMPTAAKEFLPDSWNRFPSKPGGEQTWNTFINTLGIRETKYQTPMEESIMKSFYKRNPKGEPTESAAIEAQIYKAHEQGNDDKVDELMDELPASKQKSIRQHLVRGKSAYQSMFERLPPEDKIKLYQKMTPEEEKLYDPKGRAQRLVDGVKEKE